MVDIRDRIRVHCLVKATRTQDAMAYFMLHSRDFLFSFVKCEKVNEFGSLEFVVTVSIPTETLPKARQSLNEWMAEDAAVEPPYPNGSLLSYSPKPEWPRTQLPPKWISVSANTTTEDARPFYASEHY